MPKQEPNYDEDADEHYANLAYARYTNSSNKKRDSLSYLINSGTTHCFQNMHETLQGYSQFQTPKEVKLDDDSMIYAKGHRIVNLILPSQALQSVEVW